MDIQTERGLKEAFAFLEAGNPEEASKIVQNSFLYDSISPELIFTSNCCNRWIDYIRNVMFQEDPMERGESLLAEWKNFLCYVKAQDFVYQPTVYAICRGVFSLALQNFNRLLNEKDPVGFAIKSWANLKMRKCALRRRTRFIRGRRRFLRIWRTATLCAVKTSMRKFFLGRRFLLTLKKLTLSIWILR